MEDFKNVKIIKSCEPKEEVLATDQEESIKCADFQFDDEDFLKSVDKEILFIDDSIVYENAEFLEIPPVKIEEATPSPRKSPPICFENVPIKLSQQLSLPLENVNDLAFYESFIISKRIENAKSLDIDEITDTEKSTVIGSACISIEELADGNILIFSIQQVFVDGERTVHECLSVVTEDLKLLQEKRIERKCSDGNFLEKSIYIRSTADGFSLLKSITKNEDIEYWKGDVLWTKCGNFLCLGANILMTRKLVRNSFKGCIQSYTCDIDGNFALSQHWFHKVEIKSTLNHVLVSKRVDQLMIFDDSRIEKISSFFAEETGRMLKQINDHNNYFIHINPLDDPYEKRSSRNLDESWQEDVNLMSMYLDQKSKKSQELKRKLENPHLKQLLNDYIENLIRCKPKSIMNFTVEFMRKLERNTNVNVQMQIFETVQRRNQQN